MFYFSKPCNITLCGTKLKEYDSYLQLLQLQQCIIPGDFHGIWNVKIKIGNLKIGYGNAKLEMQRGPILQAITYSKFIYWLNNITPLKQVIT